MGSHGNLFIGHSFAVSDRKEETSFQETNRDYLKKDDAMNFNQNSSLISCLMFITLILLFRNIQMECGNIDAAGERNRTKEGKF